MVTTDLIHAALRLLHILAGAAWFGSMFYSLFVLYPRVTGHFARIADREQLLLALSHGARWHMIAAMTLVGLSGVGIVLLPREAMSAAWWTLMGAKTALLIVSAIFFWRISWHWWPARLFAMESELPAIHWRFRLGGACMFVLVGLNAVLGILSRIG